MKVYSTNKVEVEVDVDNDPLTALVVDSETETDYLFDPNNFTGYAQIIEEVVRDYVTKNHQS